MSLLPALFQNIDPMPMALGAKIVAPVPKKLDPIEAFEKGVHTPDGKVHFGIDKGQGEFTAFESRYVNELKKWIRKRGIFEKAKTQTVGVMLDPAIPIGEATELRVCNNRPNVGKKILGDYPEPWETATPRQNAIAAKMAEVQRQKQELRALVRKDYKR